MGGTGAPNVVLFASPAPSAPTVVDQPGRHARLRQTLYITDPDPFASDFSYVGYSASTPSPTSAAAGADQHHTGASAVQFGEFGGLMGFGGLGATGGFEGLNSMPMGSRGASLQLRPGETLLEVAWQPLPSALGLHHHYCSPSARTDGNPSVPSSSSAAAPATAAATAAASGADISTSSSPVVQPDDLSDLARLQSVWLADSEGGPSTRPARTGRGTGVGEGGSGKPLLGLRTSQRVIICTCKLQVVSSHTFVGWHTTEKVAGDATSAGDAGGARVTGLQGADSNIAALIRSLSPSSENVSGAVHSGRMACQDSVRSIAWVGAALSYVCESGAVRYLLPTVAPTACTHPASLGPASAAAVRRCLGTASSPQHRALGLLAPPRRVTRGLRTASSLNSLNACIGSRGNHPYKSGSSSGDSGTEGDALAAGGLLCALPRNQSSTLPGTQQVVAVLSDRLLVVYLRRDNGTAFHGTCPLPQLAYTQRPVNPAEPLALSLLALDTTTTTTSATLLSAGAGFKPQQEVLRAARLSCLTALISTYFSPRLEVGGGGGQGGGALPSSQGSRRLLLALSTHPLGAAARSQAGEDAGTDAVGYIIGRSRGVGDPSAAPTSEPLPAPSSAAVQIAGLSCAVSGLYHKMSGQVTAGDFPRMRWMPSGVRLLSALRAGRWGLAAMELLGGSSGAARAELQELLLDPHAFAGSVLPHAHRSNGVRIASAAVLLMLLLSSSLSSSCNGCVSGADGQNGVAHSVRHKQQALALQRLARRLADISGNYAALAAVMVSAIAETSLPHSTGDPSTAATKDAAALREIVEHLDGVDKEAYVMLARYALSAFPTAASSSVGSQLYQAFGLHSKNKDDNGNGTEDNLVRLRLVLRLLEHSCQQQIVLSDLGGVKRRSTLFSAAHRIHDEDAGEEEDDSSGAGAAAMFDGDTSSSSSTHASTGSAPFDLQGLEQKQHDHLSGQGGGVQGPPLALSPAVALSIAASSSAATDSGDSDAAVGTVDGTGTAANGAAAAASLAGGLLPLMGPRSAGLLALDVVEDYMGIQADLEYTAPPSTGDLGAMLGISGGAGGVAGVVGMGVDGLTGSVGLLGSAALAAGVPYMGAPVPPTWVDGLTGQGKEHEQLMGYWRFSDVAFPAEEELGLFHSCSTKPGARLVFLDLSRFEGPGLELYSWRSGALRVEESSSPVEPGERHENVKSLCDVVYLPQDLPAAAPPSRTGTASTPAPAGLQSAEAAGSFPAPPRAATTGGKSNAARRKPADAFATDPFSSPGSGSGGGGVGGFAAFGSDFGASSSTGPGAVKGGAAKGGAGAFSSSDPFAPSSWTSDSWATGSSGNGGFSHSPFGDSSSPSTAAAATALDAVSGGSTLPTWGMRCAVPRGSQLDVGLFHEDPQRAKLTFEMMVCFEPTAVTVGSGGASSSSAEVNETAARSSDAAATSKAPHVLLRRSLASSQPVAGNATAAPACTAGDVWCLYVDSEGAVCFEFAPSPSSIATPDPATAPGGATASVLKSAPGAVQLSATSSADDGGAGGGSGQWTHIAVVLDSSKSKCSLEEASSSHSSPPAFAPSPDSFAPSSDPFAPTVAVSASTNTAPSTSPDVLLSSTAIHVTLYIDRQRIQKDLLPPKLLSTDIALTTMHVGPNLCGGWRLTELRAWAAARSLSELEVQRESCLALAMKRKRLQLRIRGAKKLFAPYRDIDVDTAMPCNRLIMPVLRHSIEFTTSTASIAGTGNEDTADADAQTKDGGGSALGSVATAAAAGGKLAKPAKPPRASLLAAPGTKGGLLNPPSATTAVSQTTTTTTTTAAGGEDSSGTPVPMTARQRRLSTLKAAGARGATPLGKPPPLPSVPAPAVPPTVPPTQTPQTLARSHDSEGTSDVEAGEVATAAPKVDGDVDLATTGEAAAAAGKKEKSPKRSVAFALFPTDNPPDEPAVHGMAPSASISTSTSSSSSASPAAVSITTTSSAITTSAATVTATATELPQVAAVVTVVSMKAVTISDRSDGGDTFCAELTTLSKLGSSVTMSDLLEYHSAKLLCSAYCFVFCHSCVLNDEVSRIECIRLLDQTDGDDDDLKKVPGAAASPAAAVDGAAGGEKDGAKSLGTAHPHLTHVRMRPQLPEATACGSGQCHLGAAQGPRAGLRAGRASRQADTHLWALSGAAAAAQCQ